MAKVGEEDAPMWKANWSESKRRFVDWWDRKGVVLGLWWAQEVGHAVHETVPAPVIPATWQERYCNPAFRAAENHYHLSRSVFPLDVLPCAHVDLGPGSLALLLGATPGFSPDTVWFHPCMETEPEPEKLPPLRFDANNPWWRITEDLLRHCAELARGKYFVGCPDLIENLDVLSSLRGAQTLCLDMLERPEWVEQKVWEINNVWFEAYQRIYDIIKLEDDSSAFGAFCVWGPGKTAKLQCDSSAMISPAMFRRFVVPALTAQCDWLDQSLYHLDGTQAMGHLDALLEIESLDAIEWTPQSGIEDGSHPRWYDLYRRILAAGKSVQVVGVKPDEVMPLLDAIGTDGVYILLNVQGVLEADRFDRIYQRQHVSPGNIGLDHVSG